jgi:hypothetical protein
MKRISKPVLFGLGLVPGLIIVLWYNYHLTGSITKTPYNFEVHQQKTKCPVNSDLICTTLSAFWGLVFLGIQGCALFYAPVSPVNALVFL